MDNKNRNSFRLKNYSYSQIGSYFITCCTHQKNHLFGKIINGEVHLNSIGKIVEKFWYEIPNHYSQVLLDEFIIMPNHVHFIIGIEKKVSELMLKNGTSQTVGSIVRGFKIGVTKWVRENTKIKNIWQRNYYEHIIRDERELYNIRYYIKTNPKQWNKDKYNL